MSRAWFSYNGPTGGELNSKYYYIITTKPTCLDGTPNVCSVYAIYSPETYGSSPVPFSTQLLLYISNVKATSSAQPSIPTDQKKYVYSYPG